MPRNCVVESRLDIKTLASLAIYYQRHGITFRSKSEFVNQVVEDFFALIDAKGLAQDVSNNEEALAILSNAGLTKFHSKKGVRRRYLKELEESGSGGVDGALEDIIEQARNHMEGAGDGDSNRE